MILMALHFLQGMDWYASALESKYAMQILLAIKEHPGASKTEIMRMDSTNEKTRYARINHMIKIGLIEVQTGGNQWNTSRLYLTPAGQEIASHVESINRIMKRVHESLPDEEPADSEERWSRRSQTRYPDGETTSKKIR